MLTIGSGLTHRRRDEEDCWFTGKQAGTATDGPQKLRQTRRNTHLMILEPGRRGAAPESCVDPVQPLAAEEIQRQRNHQGAEKYFQVYIGKMWDKGGQ